MGCLDPRVAHPVSAARLQLCRRADGQESPSAVGPEASGRSRLEVRMSRPLIDLRGRVGMCCLIAAESAIFTIFLVAYLFYIGICAAGPTPADIQHLSIYAAV